jgi:Domain of unknown function (DUF4280)
MSASPAARRSTSARRAAVSGSASCRGRRFGLKQRRDHDVRAGIVAVDAGRTAHAPRDVGFATRRDDHGLQAVREHPWFRGLHWLANPQVIAATSAALGVFTPQPCIPATTSPWAPGNPTAPVGGMPVLTNTSTCQCMWGGVIAIMSPPSTVVGVGVSVRLVRPLITVHFFPGAVSCEPEADAGEPAELSIG